MKVENDTKITDEALTLLGFKKKEGGVFEQNEKMIEQWKTLQQ